MDAQAYGSKNDRRQSETQHDLPRLLDRAARGAGLDRSEWQIQQKGDEQLAVRPLDGTEPRLVDDFVRHLAAELREFNAQRVPEARMRLRGAIHQGPVELAGNGFAGTAVVVTARLLNSRPLYDALAAHPAADLAVLLSDDVFRSTVAGGHTTLSVSDFERVAVEVKEYEATAWLRVPALGASVTVVEAREASDAPKQPAAGNAIRNDYQAEQISVTNIAGDVDARGAVFGFGSAGG